MKKIITLFWVILMIFSLALGLTACLEETEITYSGEGSSQNSSSDNDTATTGEKMALSSAKNYLRTMAFSKQGLIEQLEFEGFTSEEAAYGAEQAYE